MKLRGKTDRQTEVDAPFSLSHSQCSKNVPKELGGETSIDSTSQAKGDYGSKIPPEGETVKMSAKEEKMPNSPFWVLLEQFGYTRW